MFVMKTINFKYVYIIFNDCCVKTCRDMIYKDFVIQMQKTKNSSKLVLKVFEKTKLKKFLKYLQKVLVYALKLWLLLFPQFFYFPVIPELGCMQKRFKKTLVKSYQSIHISECHDVNTNCHYTITDHCIKHQLMEQSIPK